MNEFDEEPPEGTNRIPQQDPGLIQGVSEVLKCWYQVQFGREFEHKEKIEI